MGHDETRGKPASDSPKAAEEGTNPGSELADLHSVFDSIDDSMKDVARREATVTPEAREPVVNDPVTRAAVPLTPLRAKLERLQGAMGLDEIEFEGPAARPAAPAQAVGHGTLSKQMGVHDFEFDDIPGPAAEPAAPAPLDIDAVTEWMNESAGTPDVQQLRATAGGKAKTREGEPAFDWVAAELAALDVTETGIAADPPAAPLPDPDLELPLYQAPKPVAPAIEQPRAEFDKPSTSAPGASAFARATADKSADKEGLSPPVHQPEVRDTRSGLAGWFRSALGDKSPQREPGAAAPDPKPQAPLTPAAIAAPQPEPEVEAPAPVAVPLEEKPSPTRDPAAALRPLSPDEAAERVRFTFDPIPPVPPRLPREPKEPPKR